MNTPSPNALALATEICGRLCTLYEYEPRAELARLIDERVGPLVEGLANVIDAIPEETLVADPPLRAWSNAARAALDGWRMTP